MMTSTGCKNNEEQCTSVTTEITKIIKYYRNSSGDEITNVNFFMMTSYMYYKVQQTRV